MSQPVLAAVPQSLGQRLQAQQTAMKVEAAEALKDLSQRLADVAAEAHELSKVNGVFDKTVSEQLEKFVTFASGSLPILAKGHPKDQPIQTQARAA